MTDYSKIWLVTNSASGSYSEQAVTGLTDSFAAAGRKIDHVLTIPAEDDSCDFIVYFSVITHLLHEESFRYLRDAARALTPGGKIVATFLEARRHWSIFERVVDIYPLDHVNEPLVMFIERTMLEVWAEKLGLEIEQIISFDPPGQSVAVLRKP